MNYNKVCRVIKPMWQLFGLIIYAIAVYVICVVKTDAYSATMMKAIAIYHVCGIVIKIVMYCIDKKAGNKVTED